MNTIIENMRNFVTQDIGFEIMATTSSEEREPLLDTMERDVASWSKQDLEKYIIDLGMTIDDFK